VHPDLELRRNENLPVSEARQECSPPFRQSRLAPIDLLAAADERDDDRLIRVPLHHLQQNLRFGERPAEFPLRLSRIPSPLRRIEDGDPVDWNLARLHELSVDESMHILDEGLNLSSRFPEVCLTPLGGISRQRFGEHADKWTVA
jgi:hypothetical protein